MVCNKYSKSCVALGLVLQAAAVLAQGRPGEWPGRFYGPASPLPPELCFRYHHASTALEGALRGRAQVIHATGSYWLDMSQSLICREEAHCLVQANRERRIAWCQLHRDGLAQRRQTSIEKQRLANDAAQPARYEVYRLAATQLDRTIGMIVWPQLLMASAYDELRGRLDELFREEARDVGSLPDRRAEVVLLVRTLSDALRRNRLGVAPPEYLDNAKFLCGLKLEAEFPLGGVEAAETRNVAKDRSAGQQTPSWEVN